MDEHDIQIVRYWRCINCGRHANYGHNNFKTRLMCRATAYVGWTGEQYRAWGSLETAHG